MATPPFSTIHGQLLFSTTLAFAGSQIYEVSTRGSSA